MHKYALTVKKTRNPKNISQYYDYLTWLGTKGIKHSDLHFEDTRGLHFHCIISSEDKIQYSDLKRDQYGWNFKMVPLYNEQGWVKYSSKDSSKGIETQHKLEELNEEDPRVRSELKVYYLESSPEDELIDIPENMRYPHFDVRKYSSSDKN